MAGGEGGVGGDGGGAPPAAKRPRFVTPPPAAEAKECEVLERVGRLLLSKVELEKLAANDELCDDALALAAASGVVMYRAPADKARASVVPIALLPSPVDAAAYHEAVSTAPIFHKLMDRIACDLGWLRGALKETAELDEICRGLLGICGRVYGPHGPREYPQDIRVHIMRNDFMLDASTGSPSGEEQRRGRLGQNGAGPPMTQIELNMIAASFSAHAQDLTEVHRHVLAKHLHRCDPTLPPEAVTSALFSALPVSPAAEGIAGALAEAFRAYEERWPALRRGAAGAFPPRCVLVVAEVDENNELDHRKLESALFRDHGIIALRRSLAQLGEGGASPTPMAPVGVLDIGAPQPRRPLVVDGHEVAVAYFRSGYWPAHYGASGSAAAARCWAAREAIEASDAAKCPAAPAQLAGMKKVQQLLCDSAILRRFVPEAGEAERLERLFARIGDPSPGGGAEGERCVEAALTDPSSWVLKPQVEGSGELFFDESIPEVLKSKAPKELAEYILMERVRPPVLPSLVHRTEEGARGEFLVRDSVAELGIFGAFVADGAAAGAGGAGGASTAAPRLNEAVGHLLRSKAHSTNQGGVFVGNAVVDAPLLLPSELFWRSVRTK